MRQAEWSLLMANLGFGENTDVFTDLKKRYNEQHRKYHNVAHIDSVLTELEKTQHIAENKNSIQLALWFHDAIYNTFSKSNEKDSADLAVAFISDNSGSQQLQQTVHSLIMATEHNFTPKLNDQKLIVDIDLSILGSSESQYAEFESAIRKEYKYVPWFIFKKKRIEVLQYFLDREAIFSHVYYFDLLEKQARVNITNAIDKLQRRSGQLPKSSHRLLKRLYTSLSPPEYQRMYIMCTFVRINRFKIHHMADHSILI